MTERMVKPPEPAQLRPYRVPDVARGRLANGLTVVAVKHAPMPLVTVRIVLDAGTIREPADRSGTATLTVHSLDTGAAGRSGDQLAWEFERLGVELETETAWDASSLGATVAVERLDPTLALLADVMRRPDFPATEVDRIRGEHLAEILQRRKEPRALAGDMVLQLLFGNGHAYGRPPIGLPEHVGRLTRADVQAFHAATVAPAHTALLLVGDVEPERALAAAEEYFGDWAASSPPDSLPTPAVPRAGAATHIVHRAGSVQSEIRVGHLGVERRHPDYFALRVMNAILGGAFTSRLNLSLRERHGFTYGVRSGFAFRRTPGPFLIQTAVATDVTGRAVEEILREVHLMRDSGVTDAEVADARDYLAGVVPLELQTTDQVASRFADLVIHDLPDDYFQHYRDALASVTTEEVVLAARNHLHPERLLLCVVGDADAIEAPLTALARGPVEIHKVPEPQ